MHLHGGAVRGVGEHACHLRVVGAHAEPSDRAGLDELFEHRHEIIGFCLVHGRVVQLVEVDAVALQPAQRFLNGAADVGRADVAGGELASLLVEQVAELGRDADRSELPITSPSSTSLCPAP